MNRSTLKRISRHTENLLIEWLKGLVSEEEADQVTLDNLKELIPKEYHFHYKESMILAPNSPKWIRKQLKKLVSADPSIDIESVTLEQLQWHTMKNNHTLL